MTNGSVGMGEQGKAGQDTIEMSLQQMLKASAKAGATNTTGSLAFSMRIPFHCRKAG